MVMGTCDGEVLLMINPFANSISMVSFTNGRYFGASGYGCCLIGLASGLNSISCMTTCSGTPEGSSVGKTSICLCSSITNLLTACLSISAGICFNACCIGVGDDCLLS